VLGAIRISSARPPGWQLPGSCPRQFLSSFPEASADVRMAGAGGHPHQQRAAAGVAASRKLLLTCGWPVLGAIRISSARPPGWQLPGSFC